MSPGFVAQSVASRLQIQGSCVRNTFVEIDPEIFSAVFVLLPLLQEGLARRSH